MGSKPSTRREEELKWNYKAESSCLRTWSYRQYRFGGTVYDLEELELAYAPPYSSAKDPVNMAGYVAANCLKGDMEILYWDQVDQLDRDKVFILDVRAPEDASNGSIEGSVNIPLNDLRARIDEVPRDREIIVYCYKYIIPAHQGRGAEQVLFQTLIKKGQDVLGNMHFDTTMAHIELSGGRAVNLVHERAYDTQTPHPFKGDTDLEKLEKYIKEKGAENIAFMIITITCNSAGGQPVSMANIRATSEICKKYGIKVFLDAARYAENAYFIKTREAGYQDKSIREIVREMFSYAEGFTMSAKKDGLVNIGAFL